MLVEEGLIPVLPLIWNFTDTKLRKEKLLSKINGWDVSKMVGKQESSESVCLKYSSPTEAFLSMGLQNLDKLQGIVV